MLADRLRSRVRPLRRLLLDRDRGRSASSARRFAAVTSGEGRPGTRQRARATMRPIELLRKATPEHGLGGLLPGEHPERGGVTARDPATRGRERPGEGDGERSTRSGARARREAVSPRASAIGDSPRNDGGERDRCSGGGSENAEPSIDRSRADPEIHHAGNVPEVWLGARLSAFPMLRRTRATPPRARPRDPRAVVRRVPPLAPHRAPRPARVPAPSPAKPPADASGARDIRARLSRVTSRSSPPPRDGPRSRDGDLPALRLAGEAPETLRQGEVQQRR